MDIQNTFISYTQNCIPLSNCHKKISRDNIDDFLHEMCAEMEICIKNHLQLNTKIYLKKYFAFNNYSYLIGQYVVGELRPNIQYIKYTDPNYRKAIIEHGIEDVKIEKKISNTQKIVLIDEFSLMFGSIYERAFADQTKALEKQNLRLKILLIITHDYDVILQNVPTTTDLKLSKLKQEFSAKTHEQWQTHEK